MMAESPQNRTSNQQKPKRKPLRLPFDGRRQDAGSWAYDHRAGLCIVLIVYLVLGIAFFSSKILMGRKPAQTGFVIDLRDLEELEKKKNRLEEEIKRNNSKIDWSKIKNTSSNENALNENLEDAKGLDASEINEEAAAVAGRLKASKAAYEKGLKDARKAGERTQSDSKSETQASDRNVKGRVTVSFSFTDPVRHSRKLIIPAYRCEGGGEVVVQATLDTTGKVIQAVVKSGGDECMRQTALDAARKSLFDINSSAPARHQGTITYIFIPQ